METELKIGQLYTVISGPGWKTEIMEILIVGFNSKTKTYAYSKRCSIQSYGLIKAAELRFSLVLKGQKLPINVYPENDTHPEEIRFNFETEDPDKLRACIESTCVNLDPWKRIRIFYFRFNNVVTQYSGGVRLFLASKIRLLGCIVETSSSNTILKLKIFIMPYSNEWIPDELK